MTIVRLSTRKYSDWRGIGAIKQLRILKRFSTGENVIFNAITELGLTFVIGIFENFYTAADGLYLVSLNADSEQFQLISWSKPIRVIPLKRPRGRPRLVPVKS